MHFRAVDLEDAPGIFRELRARHDPHRLRGVVFHDLDRVEAERGFGRSMEQIDFDKRLWTKPPEMMKAGVEHVVPLSSAALEILEHQARVRTGDSVFPGVAARRSPTPTSSKALGSAKAGHRRVDAARLAQRVSSDYCGDVAEDVSWDLAEAALAHSLDAGSKPRIVAVPRSRSAARS